MAQRRRKPSEDRIESINSETSSRKEELQERLMGRRHTVTLTAIAAARFLILTLFSQM